MLHPTESHRTERYMEMQANKEIQAIHEREIEQTQIMLSKSKENLCSSYHRWTELAQDHVENMDKYCQ